MNREDVLEARFLGAMEALERFESTIKELDESSFVVGDSKSFNVIPKRLKTDDKLLNYAYDVANQIKYEERGADGEPEGSKHGGFGRRLVMEMMMRIIRIMSERI